MGNFDAATMTRIKSRYRKQHPLFEQSNRAVGGSFDELYFEISDHWEDKARRLQARRWRKIKHQLV